MELNTFNKTQELVAFVRQQRENRQFVRSVEITATLILISFFTFFAIKPTVLVISTLLGEIKSKELLVVEMGRKINQVIEAQDKFAQIQENFDLIESSLPSRPRYVQTASIVNNIGSQTNLPLESINFGLTKGSAKTTATSLAPSYSVALSVSGDYQSVIRYITYLAKNRRVFSVPRITFSIAKKEQNTDSNQTLPVSLSVNPEFYYWPPVNEKK